MESDGVLQVNSQLVRMSSGGLVPEATRVDFRICLITGVGSNAEVMEFLNISAAVLVFPLLYG